MADLTPEEIKELEMLRQEFGAKEELSPEEQAELEALRAEFKPVDTGQFSSDVKEIAKRYNVPEEFLLSRAVGMGFMEVGPGTRDIKSAKDLSEKAKLTAEMIGTQGAAAVNSILGEGVLGGLPSFAYKKLVATDQEEAAIDELRPVIERYKPKFQQATEMVASLAPAGALFKTATAPGKLAKVAGITGLATESGTRAAVKAPKGEEVKEFATGAALPLAGGAAGVLAPTVMKTSVRLLPIAVPEALKKAAKGILPKISSDSFRATLKATATAAGRLGDKLKSLSGKTGLAIPIIHQRLMEVDPEYAQKAIEYTLEREELTSAERNELELLKKEFKEGK